jgi:hypothetical protein
MEEGMDGGGHGFVSMQSFSAKNQVQSLGQPSCKQAAWPSSWSIMGHAMPKAALAAALYFFFFSPPAIVFLALVHNRVHNFVGFH